MWVQSRWLCPLPGLRLNLQTVRVNIDLVPVSVSTLSLGLFLSARVCLPPINQPRRSGRRLPSSMHFTAGAALAGQTLMSFTDLNCSRIFLFCAACCSLFVFSQLIVLLVVAMSSLSFSLLLTLSKYFFIAKFFTFIVIEPKSTMSTNRRTKQRVQPFWTLGRLCVCRFDKKMVTLLVNKHEKINSTAKWRRKSHLVQSNSCWWICWSVQWHLACTK